jgi:hypothetical protein
MDVGGGTVDMAILYKESPADFSVTSKDIRPLGIEIVSRSLSRNDSNIDRVKENLRDKKRLSDLPYILTERESELKEHLKSCFAALVMDSKKKDIYDIKEKKHILRLHHGELPVIICGGGAKHKWYEDAVEQKSGDLRPVLAEGLKLKILPVEKLFSANFHLNHRLLIAYALSGRIGNEIPELQGYPWHFVSNASTRTRSDEDRHYELSNRRRELYGDD